MTTLHNEPDMIGFELTHSLLRAEIGRLARTYARPIHETDTELIEDQLRLVAEHLVRHHQEEDDFHWPLLARRAPELVELLDQLQAEHSTLDPQLLVILDRARPQFERSEALAELARTLTDHFDDEDRVVIPALRRHISATEQSGSMERSRRKIPAADELRVLSMMLDAATDEQLQRMLAVLPAEVIELWRTVGIPQLADIHGRLR
ncbi:MAG: hemerythrin cation binding domain protein [Ilumatobacteraceae bacterium]|nr:hemerythrin cation binding domain protein [Ilumatobacteraceae bacterium]